MSVEIEQIEEVAKEFHDTYFGFFQDMGFFTPKYWDEWEDDDPHKRSIRQTIFFLVDRGVIELPKKVLDE